MWDSGCVQSGWVRKAEPGHGLLWFRGIGPAWLSGPWSLPLLALKCRRWVSVRKLRHCPSAGLPPRMAASILGPQPGPPHQGSCHLLPHAAPHLVGDSGHQSQADAPGGLGPASLAVPIVSFWGARLGKEGTGSPVRLCQPFPPAPRGPRSRS